MAKKGHNVYRSCPLIVPLLHTHVACALQLRTSAPRILEKSFSEFLPEFLKYSDQRNQMVWNNFGILQELRFCLLLKKKYSDQRTQMALELFRNSSKITLTSTSLNRFLFENVTIKYQRNCCLLCTLFYFVIFPIFRSKFCQNRRRQQNSF